MPSPAYTVARLRLAAALELTRVQLQRTEEQLQTKLYELEWVKWQKENMHKELLASIKMDYEIALHVSNLENQRLQSLNKKLQRELDYQKRKQLLQKTRLCVYFPAGKCEKGDKCDFIHAE